LSADASVIFDVSITNPEGKSTLSRDTLFGAPEKFKVARMNFDHFFGLVSPAGLR
jgi:hypothetical protein